MVERQEQTAVDHVRFCAKTQHVRPWCCGRERLRLDSAPTRQPRMYKIKIKAQAHVLFPTRSNFLMTKIF